MNRSACERVLVLTAALAVVFFVSFWTGAVSAQTGIRAHYANGQIWVVWETPPPLPETFAIYGSYTPITSLGDAEMIGRLFEYEYFPGALRDQFGPPDAGWVIPATNGADADTLAGDEALFVETVHAAGPRYYAVVAWGDTIVNPGVNATMVPAIAPIFQPGEEVACHLQLEISPLADFVTRAFYMWADGREDPEDARPDIPVMANPAKNGMPSLFLVSARTDLSPGPHPVAYWLHGGGGRARQSVPGSREIYGIDPANGLLVAHNDDLVRWLDIEGAPSFLDELSNSQWFGWGLHHDPFAGGTVSPPPGEVIINYTQRRLGWIHHWLVDKGWVDPQRTSVIGHSAGAAGTTALGKAFPDLFGSCTIFNNGFGDLGGSTNGGNLFGPVGAGILCNLMNAAGDSVPVHKVFDLNTPITDVADLPFFRVFHGKNDDNGSMAWDAFVVEEYARADSIGWGAHLYWDERPHSPSPSNPGHWAAGYGMTEQTERDNVHYQEKYFARRAFPAFYNHRIQPGASDPGDGTRGTGGAGVGDDWGTWGGYHDWEIDTLVDEVSVWEATIYLIGLSVWTVDNCPSDSLVSDFMIRKPQDFLPSPGETVAWAQIEVASGDTLNSDVLVADTEGRVRLSNLVTYRDPRRTRIRFWRPSVTSIAVDDRPASRPRIQAMPNPFNPQTTIRFTLQRSGNAELVVFDLRGLRVTTLLKGWTEAGEHSVSWNGRDAQGRSQASGTYLLRLRGEGFAETSRVALVR